MVLQAKILHCNAILGRGQPGLMIRIFFLNHAPGAGSIARPAVQRDTTVLHFFFRIDTSTNNDASKSSSPTTGITQISHVMISDIFFYLLPETLNIYINNQNQVGTFYHPPVDLTYLPSQSDKIAFLCLSTIIAIKYIYLYGLDNDRTLIFATIMKININITMACQ